MSDIFLDRYGRERHLEDQTPVEKKGFFAIMIKDDRVLVTYPLSTLTPEFPGGSIRRKESIRDCLYRKLYEETGIEFMLGYSDKQVNQVIKYFAEEERPKGVFYIYDQTFIVYDASKYGLNTDLIKWRAPDGSHAEWVKIDDIYKGKVMINHVHWLAFQKIFLKKKKK